MIEISEEEACRRAGDSEPPLLAKSENDATQSAVALKRFPDCFVLGISCDTQDRFRIFAFDDEQEAWAAFARHEARMQQSGTPFFD